MSDWSESVTIVRRMDALQFDAVVREAHESTMTVTENPVETGVSIADHMYANPLRLSIAAVVTDTPMRAQAGDRFASERSRSQRAYELLMDLQRRREPFEVQTGLRLYRDMVCTGLRTEQDKDTARVLSFEAELREVLIVSTQVVKYPPRKAGATTRQASTKKVKGQVAGKDKAADAAKTGTTSGQSLASRLKGYIKP